jgi:peptidoglycan-N-acetylmuramic acid deacetylase
MLVFSITSSSTSAANDTEKINWFFKSKGENLRPDIPLSSILKDSDALYIGPEDDKTVYLTFDAGYGNENVEKILDVLKSHEIKAAFFILPGIIKNSESLVKRMAEDGHTVCNHTTTHGDMAKVTDVTDFKNELDGVKNLYRERTGREMADYFRPPEGSFSKRTLEFCKELKVTPVFWSFAYADWDNAKQPSPEKAKDKILSSIHNGAVILLHPTSKTNADILDDVISELTARGYSFGTLDELYEKTTK